MDKDIKTLEQEIATQEAFLFNLKKIKKEKEDAIRENVKPIFKWVAVRRHPRQHDSFDFMYDTSIVKYYIYRECMNKDEMRAAKISDWNWSTGGMDYLFNTGNGMLITGISGGTLIFNAEEKDRHLWLEVSEFLCKNPDGGDLTHIFVGE